MLGRDEPVMAHVNGLHDSGILVTNRRLLAWRVNGISPGLELADVDRIHYDRGPTDALVVVPRAPAHAPLVVIVDPADRGVGEAVVAARRPGVLARARARGATVTAEEGE